MTTSAVSRPWRVNSHLRVILCVLLLAPALVLATGSGVEAQVESPLVINEYSAADYGREDRDDSRRDWIELYNQSGQSVNLSGWYLSDRLDNPTKWRIPSGSISAGQVEAFWADETNFGLNNSSGKDHVVLANPQGLVVDWIKLEPTQANHSRGRSSDGADDWALFTDQTRDQTNQNPKNEYASRPEVSPAPGYHAGPVTITLTSPDPGVELRYTTNGRTPTSSATLYSGPFTISDTTALKVRAFSPDVNTPPSFTEFGTYFIGDTHTHYVISLTDGDTNELEKLLDGDRDVRLTGGFELYSPDGDLIGRAEGEVNGHGQDSWAYDQRGLDFLIRDQLGQGDEIDHKVFPNKERTKFDRFIIRNVGDDNYPGESGGAHLRDSFVQEVSQRAGLRMDERSYVPAVMYVNGEYWGSYEIREKVVHQSFTDAYYDLDGDSVDMISFWGVPTQIYGSRRGWDAMIDQIFDWNHDLSNQSRFDEINDQVELLSLVDYLLMNGHVAASDLLNFNTAWWRGTDPDGAVPKWRYVLWDMDAVFGHGNNWSISGGPRQIPEMPICTYLSVGNIKDPELHLEMMYALNTNDGFAQMVAGRYITLLNSYLDADAMIAVLDEIEAQKMPEMPRQIERWGGSMNEWRGNVEDTRDFIRERHAFLFSNQPGGLECLGADDPGSLTVAAQPAAAGQRVTVNALDVPLPHSGTYYGSINTVLEAADDCCWAFSHWESVAGVSIADPTNPRLEISVGDADSVIAHFVPRTPELVINELNYHVDVVVNPDGSVVPDTEFVEIHNRGANTVDLSGVSFTQGVTYTFPDGTSIAPGAFLVVAEDDDSFSEAYGFEPVGQYSGSLSNGGETITLRGPLGQVLDSLTWDDSDGWDDAADGLGRSLELVDPAADNNAAGSWLASQNLDGTPGAQNSVFAVPIVATIGNQLYAVGEPVALDIEALDEDAVTWSAAGLPAGLTIDPASGLITGSVAAPVETTVTLTATNAEGQTSVDVPWVVIDTPVSAALALNEYNAVAADANLGAGAGSDTEFGQVVGNGGDWMEFVVTTDDADLRGWTIELWDRDRESSDLTRTDTFELANDARLSGLAAGTIITISEELADELSYDPAAGDSTLHLQANSTDAGALITVESQSNFDTNRRGFRVIVRNAAGEVTAPILGETEAYRAADRPNVSAEEVWVVCANPATTTDFLAVATAEAATSTFGRANSCAGVDQNLYNSAPVVTVPGDQRHVLGDTVSLAASATDADGDTITFAASGLPDGITIDAATGAIAGTLATTGTTVIEVTATDIYDARGTGSFTWTVVPVEVVVEVQCGESEAQILVTVSNTTGSFATYGVTVDGTTDQRSISDSLTTLVTRTIDTDGAYPVAVERNSQLIHSSNATVDCGIAPPPAPEPTPTPTPEPRPANGIMHAVTCLAGNGRVDTNIVNTGDAPAVYRVEFGGLSARQSTIAVGDWWRQPITGRPDDNHQVVVKRDGVVVSDTTVTVACDTDEPTVSADEVQIVNACRDGFGYLLFQFANPTDAERVYVIEFDGVRNRSTTAQPHGGGLRAVTGRPAGSYDAAIRVGSTYITTMTIETNC